MAVGSASMPEPGMVKRNRPQSAGLNRTIGRQATDCRGYAAKRLTPTATAAQTDKEKPCNSVLSRACRDVKEPTMAKLVAPLLSFEGSGQIAKTQVYSSWKGVPYARRYTQPANPRSTEQMLTRDVFSWLNFTWRTAPTDFVAPWRAAVVGRPLIDRNLWIKQNNAFLRSLFTLDGMVFSPGAKGGLASPVTITPGVASLTFAGAAPTPLPSGWSVVMLVGAAIKDQDPHGGTDFEVFTVTDSTSAYSVVMPGLEATTDYAAAGWWVYQRSASPTDLAYSAANAQIVTTT
jgi:hypothetical protein